MHIKLPIVNVRNEKVLSLLLGIAVVETMKKKRNLPGNQLCLIMWQNISVTASITRINRKGKLTVTEGK